MDLRELKLNLSELINNLNLRIDSISVLLRDLQLDEANERLAYLIEDIMVAAQSVAMLQDSFPLLDLDELNSKLSMFLEQAEKGDYLYAADLLSYELKPLLEYWGEQLQDA